MKTFKKLLIPLVIILALGFGFWRLKLANQNTSVQNENTVRTYKANLTINDGVTTTSLDASQYVGKSVLVATQDATGGKVTMTGSGENAFVTSINDSTADKNKREFWELFVNGLSSQVGAGSYIIKDGDQIEWHINKF
jgi:hypothetical protein